MTTTINNKGATFIHKDGSTDIEIYAVAPVVLPISEVIEDLIGLLSNEQATEVLQRLPMLSAHRSIHVQTPELA
jgi:hypothetical protein